MDFRCIRLLRHYDNAEDEDVIYIDESARYTLQAEWGDKVRVLGRKETLAIIQPLREIDRDGLIGRVSQKMLDLAHIEYGEEVLLSHIDDK
ncbi:MAG: hypothetical protein GX777_06815 [Fastidiosipila sp.]|nr:hypothetical protein [Fastidiosipila sp.]